MATAMGSASSRDARGVQPDEESANAGAVGEHALQTLSAAECFDLLEPGGVGRGGVAATSCSRSRRLPTRPACRAGAG